MSGIIKKLQLKELVGHSDEANVDVYPVTSTAAVLDSNNRSLDDILKGLTISTSTSGTVIPVIKTKMLKVYKSSSVQPTAPTGGTYDFSKDSFEAPDGWSTVTDNLSNPIWMSIGSVLSNVSDITWSTPVCISGSVTEGVIKKSYVAIVYKNSTTTPSTPVGGSYDFNSKSFTPPDGWYINEDVPVNAETWCSIRAFYSDNTETEWSTPAKAAQKKVELTAAELKTIAGQIEITANELDYMVDHITLNASDYEAIAEKVQLTTDNLKVVADNINLSSTFYENVASRMELSADDLQVIASNVELSAENLKTIANNITLSATELSMIASNVNLSTEDLTTIASKVKLSADELKIIAGNTTVSITDEQMQIIADKVDVSGALSAKDLTINGGKSYFAADGSGYVANQNIAWDSEGNLTKFKYGNSDTGTVSINTSNSTTTLTCKHLVAGDVLVSDEIEVEKSLIGGVRHPYFNIYDETVVSNSNGLLTVGGQVAYSGSIFCCRNNSEKTIAMPATSSAGNGRGVVYTFLTSNAKVTFTGTVNGTSSRSSSEKYEVNTLYGTDIGWFWDSTYAKG